MSEGNYPAVRLAATTALLQLGGNAEARYRDMLNPIESPTLRIAQGRGRTRTPEINFDSPTLRLAHRVGCQGDNNLLGIRGHQPIATPPGLLVSFVYYSTFETSRERIRMRDWVLDSGAYSAKTLGVNVDLQQYIELCQRLLATDPMLTEVFALDVIGDWKASARNTEAMWKAGVPAIPCFHIGEPEDVLRGLANDYPKIAIGGCARMREKLKLQFAQQCFARVWPKKIHGFGFGTRKVMLSLPFHSTDATSWELGPCAFGNWASYGKMSVRGSAQNLRVEIEHYLAIERDARRMWTKEMALLDDEQGRVST